MPPGISCNSLQICPKSTKSLGPNGFPFDRLMTLTTILSPTKLWSSTCCSIRILHIYCLPEANQQLSGTTKIMMQPNNDVVSKIENAKIFFRLLPLCCIYKNRRTIFNRPEEKL